MQLSGGRLTDMRLALLMLFPVLACAQVGKVVPSAPAAPAAGYDTKAILERSKALGARVEELEAQLKEKDALNKYLRSQMNFFKAQEEALIVILNGMQECVSKDGMPGFDKTSGDPICQKRQERQK
jgi:DNA repair protein RadC